MSIYIVINTLTCFHAASEMRTSQYIFIKVRLMRKRILKIVLTSFAEFTNLSISQMYINKGVFYKALLKVHWQINKPSFKYLKTTTIVVIILILWKTNSYMAFDNLFCKFHLTNIFWNVVVISFSSTKINSININHNN